MQKTLERYHHHSKDVDANNRPAEQSMQVSIMFLISLMNLQMEQDVLNMSTLKDNLFYK